MAKFLKLTRLNDLEQISYEDDVYVNMDSIKYIAHENGIGTYIEFGTPAILSVKEYPEEIMRMLEEQYDE